MEGEGEERCVCAGGCGGGGPVCRHSLSVSLPSCTPFTSSSSKRVMTGEWGTEARTGLRWMWVACRRKLGEWGERDGRNQEINNSGGKRGVRCEIQMGRGARW